MSNLKSAPGPGKRRGTVETPDDRRAQGPCHAERLVELALEQYRFGRTPEGEVFAERIEGPRVALRLRGSRDALRPALAHAYRERHGRTPNAASLADALTVLEGHAMDAPCEAAHLRVGRHDGGIVLDLGTPDGLAVLVRPDGWETVPRSPVLFRRTALSSTLPVPERGGSLDELRTLMLVTDETWPLLLGWLVAGLLPDIDHPILLLGGPAGCGKTTVAEMLVALIDPSPALLRAPPREGDQWAITSSASWLVGVDNVSGVPDWWSDALCRAVTGDGWLRRALYTDGDVAVLAYRRVVLLTSIECGALRGDLGDRALLIDLETIPPYRIRTRSDLWREFEARRPRILGALLDLLAGVLAALPGVNLPTMPRMADFARVLAAADQVRGTDSLRLYVSQRGRVAGTVLESDPVGAAILMRWGDGGEWSGTASDLHRLLTPAEPARPPHGWPRDAAGLGRRLARLAAPLLAVGVAVDRERMPGGTRSRNITIRGGAAGDGAGPTKQGARDAAQESVPSVPAVPGRPWCGAERHSGGTARDGSGREPGVMLSRDTPAGAAQNGDRDGRDGRDGSLTCLSDDGGATRRYTPGGRDTATTVEDMAWEAGADVPRADREAHRPSDEGLF